MKNEANDATSTTLKSTGKGAKRRVGGVVCEEEAEEEDDDKDDDWEIGGG